MKKLIATIGVVTSLGIGAFALNSVMPAGALSTAGSQTSSSAPDPSSPTGGKCDGPRAHFKNVLDGLVQNGTINQGQEDAIIQAFKDAAQDRPRGPVGKRHGLRLRAVEGMANVAADTIGVSVEDLRAAHQSGKSIADVATEHNVNPSDVVSAIVAAGNTKVDEAVTGGKLTSDQGDKLKAHLPDLADKFVNHTKPEGC